jgi:hypothetical protein
MKGKTDKHAELSLQLSYEKKKRIQKHIKDKYGYLNKVPAKMIRYEYIKAQAKYICELELILRLSPFKHLYGQFLSMISTPAQLEQYYIKFNEYGLLVIDEKKLEDIKPINIVFD